MPSFWVFICSLILVTKSTTDANTCQVGDIIYPNGEYIGVIGTTCIDNKNRKQYEGTQSKCQNGIIIDEEYIGDCNKEYPGSKCCQEGKPGDFGAAVCIKKRECIPYNTGDGSCLVEDIVYKDGDIIGTTGTQCLFENTYKGTQTQCVAGQVIDSVFSGDCKTENIGSICCQSGKPGETGAATCTSKDLCEPYTFDWESMLIELQDKKASWQANEANKYVYSLYTSCFCPECIMANKYILFDNDNITHVEFINDAMIGLDCNDNDILKPINDNYFNIEYYYDKAISFVERGINTDCIDYTSDTICGGSLIFEYDKILFYPTKLSFIYSELIMDAGISYSFGCMTVYESTNINTIDNTQQCVDFIAPTPTPDPFDWRAAKEELEGLLQLWRNTQINKYVYSLYTSCFCDICWIADKYILIDNNIPIYVEYDQIKLEEYGWSCTDKNDIQKPIKEYYNNIDYFYDIAIAHTQKGMDANCKNINNNNPICGGRIEYEINNILYYPMKLDLIYGPFIADAGIAYTINCLTVYESENNSNIDLTNYNNKCNDFILSSDKDNNNNIPPEPTASPIWIKGNEFADQDYIILTWKERTMSWVNAEQFCINTYDSHLGTMLSLQDWERQYDYSYFGGYNGLNDFDENGKWKWIDGTQCENDLNTCSNQLQIDTNDVNNTDFCARIPWGGFVMDKFPCHQLNNQFFCNKVRGYYLVRESKTYAEAEEYCQTVYGTHLATIERINDMKNAIIESKTLNNLWIGLYYINNENINIWLDGTEYVNRNNINIDLSDNSNCKSLYLSDSNSIIKANNLCNKALPFLCNKRVKVREYILEIGNVTFDEAQQNCETKYNTDLATIISEEDFSDALLLIPYFEEAWIGLKRNNNNEMVWFDGTECSISNGNCISYWSEYAQPIEPDFDCGWLWQNGRARTSQCNYKRNYALCNKPLKLYNISNDSNQDKGLINIVDAKKNMDNYYKSVNNNNWIVIGIYVGVLTIIFNALFFVLKQFISNKDLIILHKRKQKYVTDL